MAETKLINFRYGTYDEINGLGKDANRIYFASDKPLFYAVGKWHGIASMTSEVDRANSKTILKINGDGGYAINCEIEGETLSKDLKEKLINAYEFVQLISGEDEDAIINKWNEIVAFLQGFGEADKLLNVVVELQNNLADEVANRISADQKHTEDIKSITDLVNDMFTLVDKGDGTKYIQSKYGFASDSFISARGVDNESGGVGGLDAQAVWDLLMQNDDATKIINVAHIPDISVAKITDFTAKVGDLIANKADKATTLSGYGITDGAQWKADGYYNMQLNSMYDNSARIVVKNNWAECFALNYTCDTQTLDIYNYRAQKGLHIGTELDFGNNIVYHAGNLSPVTTDTDQTITGNKSFVFGFGSKLSLRNDSASITIDANTSGGWARDLKWTNENDDFFGSFRLGAYGSKNNLIYGYAAFDDENSSSNPSFKFYAGGKLSHKTLDVQESAHANIITNLNAEMVGGVKAENIARQKVGIDINNGDRNYMGYGYGSNGWYGGGGPAICAGIKDYYMMLFGYPNALYYKYEGIGYPDQTWKTIAFTDTNSLTPSGGTLAINGKLTVANQLTIGNATLYWDVANQCLRVNAGIASDSFLSAKGIDTTGNGQGGGGGFDAQMLWNELTISSPTNAGKVISSQFLPVQEILTPVAEDISAINVEIIALQDRIANIEQALTWQTL